MQTHAIANTFSLAITNFGLLEYFYSYAFYRWNTLLLNLFNWLNSNTNWEWVGKRYFAFCWLGCYRANIENERATFSHTHVTHLMMIKIIIHFFFYPSFFGFFCSHWILKHHIASHIRTSDIITITANITIIGCLSKWFDCTIRFFFFFFRTNGKWYNPV